MENSNTIVPGLSFILDEANGELSAVYQPAKDVDPPELTSLQEALKNSPYAGLQVFNNALYDFVAKAKSATSEFSMFIGQRKNTECRVEMHDNLMSAHLTLFTAAGDPPIELSRVLDLLAQKGIVFGLLMDQINNAVARGECENLLIASGRHMAPGKTGYFENLVLKREQEKSQLDDDAVRRYSDMSHILLVKKGDALLRRVPSLASSDGNNIKGQLVVASVVPKIEFAELTPGCERDPNDPNVLIASFAGQPVITRSGAFVNAVLEVDDVSLKTGNVEFDGTIRVRGDIQTGMRVKVTGDVVVLGMVETAEIIAGGNVTVKGGIIGRANLKPGAHALPADSARIECGGSVHAMFIENVRIKAGDSISVDGHSRNCELFARNEIVVGKPGSKNSHLAGGTAQATQLIKALNLGTSTGIKTLVQVGSDPDLVREIATKDALLQHKIVELDQTQKLIAHFKKNPQKNVGGIGDKIEATREQLASSIFVLIAEKAELEAKFELTQQAQIEVIDSIFEGVEIHIGKHVRKINDQQGAGIIRLVDDHISFS